MAHVRKDQPGSAPGYEWTEPGEVVEVHDELAHELLRIPGFSEVQPPAPTPDVELDKIEAEGELKTLRPAPETPPAAVVQEQSRNSNKRRAR